MDELLRNKLPEYCERKMDVYFAEPLNMLTAISVSIAAYWAYVVWRDTDRRDMPGLLLVIGIVFLSASQVVVHSVRHPIAMLFDELPIFIFILVYFWLMMRRYLGLDRLMAALNIGGFVGIMAMVRLLVPRTALGEGAYLLPALGSVFILGIALVSQARHMDRSHLNFLHDLPAVLDVPKAVKRRSGLLLIGAGALFALGMVFRGLDMPLCSMFPSGTHWAWHLCASGVLGLLVVAFVHHGPVRGRV